VQKKAILIDQKDNVATALCQLEKGDSVQAGIEGYTVNTVILENIPLGHKFALKNIQRGEAVVKYGETIGLATRHFGQGWHVHFHYVESQKGRGDKQ